MGPYALCLPHLRGVTGVDIIASRYDHHKPQTMSSIETGARGHTVGFTTQVTRAPTASHGLLRSTRSIKQPALSVHVIATFTDTNFMSGSQAEVRLTRIRDHSIE